MMVIAHLPGALLFMRVFPLPFALPPPWETKRGFPGLNGQLRGTRLRSMSSDMSGSGTEAGSLTQGMSSYSLML
jgi:hypothetical protein